MSERIRIHVSLIVGLTDSFTGKKPVTSQIMVSVEGSAPPVRKKEGYYVFTNLDRDVVTVIVVSPVYQQVKKRVVLSELDNKEPFLGISLLPGRLYPNRDGATIVYGKTKPLREISFAAVDGSAFYRLMSDYEGEHCRELTIFNPRSEDFTGRSFLMWQKGIREYETAHIGKAAHLSQEIYTLEQPLERRYKKADTKLYQLYVCSADEEGNYYLMIPSLTGEKIEFMCTWQTDKKQENIKFDVVVGKENKKDFS